MSWRPYNPNPWRLSTDDCAPRALSAVLRIPWGDAYDLLYKNGKEMGLMQDNKAVTWAILKMNGFHREALPDQCPECYTVADFAADHPRGVYVVATDSHIIAVIGGDWLDAWDSGSEVPLFYWYRK